MKPLHLPLEGHDLLAVERFKDDTRHMAEFLILSTHCPLGRRGQYRRTMRLSATCCGLVMPGLMNPMSASTWCTRMGCAPVLDVSPALA